MTHITNPPRKYATAYREYPPRILEYSPSILVHILRILAYLPRIGEYSLAYLPRIRVFAAYSRVFSRIRRVSCISAYLLRILAYPAYSSHILAYSRVLSRILAYSSAYSRVFTAYSSAYSRVFTAYLPRILACSCVFPRIRRIFAYGFGYMSPNEREMTEGLSTRSPVHAVVKTPENTQKL